MGSYAKTGLLPSVPKGEVHAALLGSQCQHTRLQRCLPPLLSARLGVLWLAMLTHCMSVHKCMAGNPEKRWATPERKSPEIPQHD